MLILTNTQIKNIAENLDAGMKCFYNKKTNEVKEVIDFENNEDADKELWQDLIDEIELNFEDYYIFERMTSSESFLVMADFVNKIEEEAIRKRLVWIMNRNHPFRNFKAEIENNGEYRESWFKFKSEKYIEFVEKRILEINEIEVMNKTERGQA